MCMTPYQANKMREAELKRKLMEAMANDKSHTKELSKN